MTTLSNNSPLARVSLKHPVDFLSLGFGSGYAPVAPGTFGSLAAVPLILLMAMLPIFPYLAITVVACVIGIYLCEQTAIRMNVHDHPAIVWDEVAGMMVTFIAVPLSWQSLLIGFALFRLFDIVKPWPIRVIDKRVHGGLGIMLDDILAGVFACVLTHLALANLPV